MLAQRFGDIVDEWGTVNEPVIWMFVSYGIGLFPPGKVTLGNLNDVLIPADDPRPLLRALAELSARLGNRQEAMDAAVTVVRLSRQRLAVARERLLPPHQLVPSRCFRPGDRTLSMRRSSPPPRSALCGPESLHTP